MRFSWRKPILCGYTKKTHQKERSDMGNVKAPVEEVAKELLKFEPATFPLVPESKKPAVKWSKLEPGESAGGKSGTISWGIAGGRRSGGLIFIDVDCKEGSPGMESLARLEKRHPLPDTFTVRTPSGGLHLYFWHDDAVGSKNGWEPGIDIKSEGGYVVFPGSQDARGLYEVEDNYPVARLPEPWRAMLPRYREAAGLHGEAATERMSDLHEKLKELVKGRKDVVWKAWRNVCEGKAPFEHEVAHQHGGVENFLRNKMMVRLAMESIEWASVPGEQMAEFMIGSMMNLSRGNGNTEVSKYADLEELSRRWDGARAHAQGQFAERAPEDPDELASFVAKVANEKREEPLPIDQPWVLTTADSKETYFLTDGGYVGPFSGNSTMVIGNNRFGIKSTYVDHEGKEKRMSAQQYLETYNKNGDYIDKIFLRADIESGVYDPVTHNLSLPIRTKNTPPEPKFSEQYDRVLKALGGDLYEELIGWIRYCKVDCLSSASVGLVLVGASAIGKSLLANAIAQANGMSASGGKNAFERFNYSAITNLLVFLDEDMPTDHRGNVHTELLKEMIMATSHACEEKGEKIKILNHSIRVMMAANSLDTLFARGSKSQGDKQGMARRFLVIACDEDSERARECKRILRSMHAGHPHQFVEVAKEAAEHVSWIFENVEPVAPKPQSAALEEHLKVGGDRLEIVVEVLSEMTNVTKAEEPGKPLEQYTYIKEDKVLFKAKVLLGRLNDDHNMRLRSNDLPKLLEPLRYEKSGKHRVKGKIERASSLDLRKVLEVMPDFLE